MSRSLMFVRFLVILIAVLFSTAYAISIQLSNEWALLLGVAGGMVLSGTLLLIDQLIFRKFHLLAFNLAIVGLFVGWLLGQILTGILSAVIEIIPPGIGFEGWSFLKLCTYLVTCYLGMAVTLRSSEEFHISLPFIRFQAAALKKKDYIFDQAVLLDPRIIDLASSGILDHQVVIPRFLLKDMYASLEQGDDIAKSKARRALEVLKRLEALPSLGMRYVENDFPELTDITAKIIRLARLVDANILTADINRIEQSTIESSEGIKIINIHTLSNALKPLSQSGECLEIKIQRYGKEQGQGVGYLEDGTMVVVNGGADFIGTMIKCQVLSVKHTSSGRMIFCNALEDEDYAQEEMLTSSTSNHRNYFAV